MKQNFSIALVSGADQGINDNGSHVDTFRILDAGLPLFEVSYHYAGDDAEFDTVSKLKLLTPNTFAENLPYIQGGFHLMGYLYDFLMTKAGEIGAEFLADAFVNENDEQITLPIEFKR
jgi:hypothetical protein